jgi:hypothetical protein
MPVAERPPLDRADALARQIALAAYWGLEDVPHRPDAQPAGDDAQFLALPARQDLRFNLEPYADLLNHACPTPAGLFGLPLRLLRTAFKFLLGPWLDLQTLFNQAVLKTLLHEQHAFGTYLEQVARHVRNERAELAELQVRFSGCDQDVDTLRQQQRLVLRHVVETLEKSGAAVPERRAVPPRVLAQVFVQTWLPRPPARVLALDGAGGDDLGLTALGYHVVENVSTAAHADARFDAVVCLAPGIGHEHWPDRLRPGGRAVVAVRLDGVQPPPGFRLLETAYALAGESDWTYTSDPAVVAALRARGPLDGVAYLAAEKS